MAWELIRQSGGRIDPLKGLDYGPLMGCDGTLLSQLLVQAQSGIQAGLARRGKGG